MDKGPDEPLIVNEVDVGRQLPGDDDVTTEAFKRRMVRAVELVRTIEAERGGGDMDAGGAVRQAIELLQAVESDAAELTRVDASVIASECDITRDGAVPDLVGAALGPILKIPAENAITFARFRTALS